MGKRENVQFSRIFIQLEFVQLSGEDGGGGGGGAAAPPPRFLLKVTFYQLTIIVKRKK